MSETEATPSRAQQVQVPDVLALRALFEAIKDNFIFISAAAVLIGVTASTSFLTAYLSVFDWHLIWFVQYTDIITFGLLALGIVTGSATFLQSFVQIIFTGKTHKEKRNGLFAVVVLVIVGMSLNIWGAVHTGHGYFHFVLGALSIGMTGVLIFVVASHIEARNIPTVLQCVIMLFLLIACAACLGQWLGKSVEETADFNQDVYTKDQTLNDVKIVIVMSRHTVLLKDKTIYVLPTADIARFQSIGKK